ncbi:MAG: DUF86 domain-containing protein [Patescibacteria group bacterium]
MKDDRLYLRHILDAIITVEEYLQGVEREAFMGNRMLQDAVMRELAVIGEAATKVSEGFRTAHPSMPFPKMIGLRNRLIHAYIDVDLDIVWETCKQNIPSLKVAVEEIVRESPTV